MQFQIKSFEKQIGLEGELYVREVPLKKEKLYYDINQAYRRAQDLQDKTQNIAYAVEECKRTIDILEDSEHFLGCVYFDGRQPNQSARCTCLGLKPQLSTLNLNQDMVVGLTNELANQDWRQINAQYNKAYTKIDKDDEIKMVRAAEELAEATKRIKQLTAPNELRKPDAAELAETLKHIRQLAVLADPRKPSKKRTKKSK
jgi:hypothetical protein